MGNIDIALPSPPSMHTPDAAPSIGIPDGPIPQESRSVLKDKIVTNSSPRILTVLSAFGSQSRKTESTTTEIESSRLVVSKRTVSWAEIASR